MTRKLSARPTVSPEAVQSGPAGHWAPRIACRLCSLVKLHHSPAVLLHRPPPVAHALLHKLIWYQRVLMVLLWLLAAEGADDRRWLLPVTRSVRRPYNRIQHRTTCAQVATWADVANATGHPDPWGLDPRILHDTSTGSRDGYLGTVRHDFCVLYHRSLSRAFGTHFRRVRPPAARERGSPYLASASPFMRFTELSVTSSFSCSSELKPSLRSTGPRPLSPLRFQSQGTWSQRRSKFFPHDQIRNTTGSCLSHNDV